MKQQHNRLTLSVMAVLATGIVLIYSLIMYHNNIFAVLGTGILFLFTAYFLIQNIIIFLAMRNKSANVQLKNIMDDLSAQLENISSSQTQIGKATYLYTRQTAQTITTLEKNYAQSQETLYQNLTSLSNAQNKAAKLMIKYDQNNTMKLIATMKNLRNQLNDTMVQGFEQIKPNNEEIITTLQTIAQYLKTQSTNLDQALGAQLNQVAHELQNISSSIQNVQFPAQNMAPVSQTPPDIPESLQAETTNILNTSQPETLDIPENLQAETTDIPESGQPETNDALESIQPEQTDTSKILSSELSDTTETTGLAENPAEPNAAPATEQKKTDSAETESFTPSFTVVGKSSETDTDSSPKEESQPVSTDSDIESANASPIEDDPNKQLSPDEIAALFAAADSSPKEEPASVSNEPETAPVNISPVSDDPNKQLSPDEIAALFAQMG